MAKLYSSVPSSPFEPKSYTDATECNDKDKWVKAMIEEITTLVDRGTWEEVERPTDKPVVSCKWVFKVKLDANGHIARYKARLVARGFTQTYGVDYKETYAPVTRLETLRLMFATAVNMDWEIRQIDVKNAYLYGDLEEEIYMEFPEVSGKFRLLTVRRLYPFKIRIQNFNFPSSLNYTLV